MLKSANYFNLRYFSYRSNDRLQRRSAKSTQSIQPQTFAASEPVSYRALLCPAISCPAVSCPVIWSVNFTSVIFSSPVAKLKDATRCCTRAVSFGLGTKIPKLLDDVSSTSEMTYTVSGGALNSTQSNMFPKNGHRPRRLCMISRSMTMSVRTRIIVNQ